MSGEPERFYGPLTAFEMRPGERGDYVRYSDYASLQQELSDCQSSLRAAKAERDKLLQDRKHALAGKEYWKKQAANQLARVDEQFRRAEAVEAERDEAQADKLLKK